MEDSTIYTLQEIETLKQKISAYRDTLMTLKMGNSLEDYMEMKSELDILKTQTAHIEGLTETMDEKQHTQNAVYEEQVKQFSFLLAALNHTVEELNQEILSISNKLSFSKSEEIQESNTATIQEEPPVNKSTTIAARINDITPVNTQTSTGTNQPSFMQLRNLASKIIQPQKKQENIVPIEHTESVGNLKQQRHFNQGYFQSINTPGKASIHFKNTARNQNIPISNFGNSHHSSRETNEPPKANVPSSINNVTESVNTVSLNPIEPKSESVNTDSLDPIEPKSESITIATTSESTYIKPVMPLEKIKKHTESSDVESKKQKNSLLFNIFRK